jgi:hypothetical protein
LAIDDGVITKENGNLIKWALQQRTPEGESAIYGEHGPRCPSIIVTLTDYLIKGKLSNERFSEWDTLVGNNMYIDEDYGRNLYSVKTDFTNEMTGKHYDGPLLFKRAVIGTSGHCHFCLPNGETLEDEAFSNTRISFCAPRPDDYPGRNVDLLKEFRTRPLNVPQTTQNKGCLTTVLLLISLSSLYIVIAIALVCMRITT